jgi:hypothetical protein
MFEAITTLLIKNERAKADFESLSRLILADDSELSILARRQLTLLSDRYYEALGYSNPGDCQNALKTWVMQQKQEANNSLVTTPVSANESNFAVSSGATSLTYYYLQVSPKNLDDNLDLMDIVVEGDDNRDYMELC